jgi:hypothetical protein
MLQIPIVGGGKKERKNTELTVSMTNEKIPRVVTAACQADNDHSKSKIAHSLTDF